MAHTNISVYWFTSLEVASFLVMTVSASCQVFHPSIPEILKIMVQTKGSCHQKSAAQKKAPIQSGPKQTHQTKQTIISSDSNDGDGGNHNQHNILK